MEFVGVARYLVYDGAGSAWRGAGTWVSHIEDAQRMALLGAQRELARWNSTPSRSHGVIILAPECTPIRSRYAYDGDRRQMVMRTDWEPTLAPKTDPELPEKNDEKVRTANV